MKWLIFAGLVIFVACSPQKKIDRAKDTLNKYDAGSGYCSVMFPCKDTTYVRDSIRVDTVEIQTQLPTEIVYETVNDTIRITKTVPGPTRYITRYVTRDSIIIRRDNARESQLQSQVSQLTRSQEKLFTEKDEYRKGRKTWRLYSIGTWALLLMFLVGWLWAKIHGKK